VAQKQKSFFSHVHRTANAVFVLALIGLASIVGILIVRSLPDAPQKPRIPKSGGGIHGTLQRRQVEFLAKRYCSGWVGVEKATRPDIREAIRQSKGRLYANHADAGFSTKQGWTQNDSIALQRLIAAGRRDSDSPWRTFPGNVWEPLSFNSMLGNIRTAKHQYMSMGGKMSLTENLVLAWAMKESAWNPHASAYGWSWGRSTAAGLLAITRSTYNLYARKGLFPKPFTRRYSGLWTEANMTDPVANMTAAFFILEHSPGSTLSKKLSNYYNPSDPKTGGRYAAKILAGVSFLESYRRGKQVNRISSKANAKLVGDLSNHVH
jgi:Transglycosylase SLT domain